MSEKQPKSSVLLQEVETSLWAAKQSIERAQRQIRLQADARWNESRALGSAATELLRLVDAVGTMRAQLEDLFFEVRSRRGQVLLLEREEVLLEPEAAAELRAAQERAVLERAAQMGQIPPRAEQRDEYYADSDQVVYPPEVKS